MKKNQLFFILILTIVIGLPAQYMFAALAIDNYSKVIDSREFLLENNFTENHSDESTVLDLKESGSKMNENQKIDKSEKVISLSKTEEYLKQHTKYYYTSMDSAIMSLKKAEKNISVRDTDSTITKVYRLMAAYHLRENRYDSCFYYVDHALALPGSTPMQHVDLLGMKGIIYSYKSEYEKSIETHLKALQICEENNFERLSSRVYNNLGLCYIKIKDWNKAEYYMEKALNVSEKYNIKRGVLYTLGNLAVIYSNLGLFDKSIEANKKSIEINLEMNDAAALSRNYSFLGNTYDKLDDIANSKINYEKSLEYAMLTKDTHLQATSIINSANLERKLGKYKLAEKMYQKSINIGDSLELIETKMRALSGLSMLYEDMGFFKKSLALRKDYEEAKDSVMNQDKVRSINELEIKYETEKKENDILKLQTQQLIDQNEIERNEAKINKLYAWLIASILLFSGLIIGYRQVMQNKRRIAQLKTIADTQNLERKRIAQDLHDSIGGSLAAIKTRMEIIAPEELKISSEWQNLTTDFAQTSEQLRQISHNIMPGELLRFGLTSAVKTSLEKINNDEITAQLYAHGLDKRVDFTTEINVYRIIQEGIQNILKHAKASLINVHLNKHAKNLIVMIEDNGSGFESGTIHGLGLASIIDRTKSLNGTCIIDSTIGRGTTISIEIPI